MPRVIKENGTTEMAGFGRVAALNVANFTEQAARMIRDARVESAAMLSHRYISDRFLPDKAIDLIDEAGARRRIMKSVRPTELTELEQNIERLSQEKSNLVSMQNYENV